jgi:hypothetical protein
VEVEVGVMVGVIVGVGVGVGSGSSHAASHVAFGKVPVTSTPTLFSTKSQRIEPLVSRTTSRFGRGIWAVICRMRSYPSLLRSMV